MMRPTIKVFEHLYSKQNIPDSLLGHSKRHLERIQSGEIIDDGMFIYVEVWGADENAIVIGALNGEELKFRKVLSTLRLYKGVIPETALINYQNIVRINVKGVENGIHYSEDRIYEFDAKI